MPHWKKLGKIFDPVAYHQKKQVDWFFTHAQNPFIEELKSAGLVRVHFATRNLLNCSRGAYIDLNLTNSFKVVNVANKPTIDLGPLGAFDDSGVMPHCIVDVGNKKYLYYTGWSKCVDVPFGFYIGLAISEDNGITYNKYSLAPVLGRNFYDPYIVGAPFVLYDGMGFKMWYTSATQWVKEPENQQITHYYTIKSASSNDGISWQTNSPPCFDYEGEEHAFARPIVRKANGGYEMWFSVRSLNTRYQIERAISSDAISWVRERQPYLNSTPQNWDNEMVCYAFPFSYEGKEYLLYNGNNYGKEGFGLAVLE